MGNGTAEHAQGFPEIFRPGRLTIDFLARCRMRETQFRGVEHLPRCIVAGPVHQLGILSPGIGPIADERIAEVLEMHPDLMGSTGVKPGFGQGRVCHPLQNAVIGVRCFAIPVVQRGHPFAMGRMSGYGLAD